MYWKQVWNKSQTYFDGRFNSGAFFIYLTVRPSTDGKRAPLTAINLQAAGSPQQAPPTYIAKMWKLIKFIKNVIFWRNHTDINPDDWTITKKTIRTTIHENFSKMKNSKVDRWALSLRADCFFMFLAWCEWWVTRQGCLVPLRKGRMWQPSWPASLSRAGLNLWLNWFERWVVRLSALSVQIRNPMGLLVPGGYSIKYMIASRTSTKYVITPLCRH